MALRKIDLMHKMFGESNHFCGECDNLVRFRYRGCNYRKCRVYGISRSEASDWARRWNACGMFNKEWKDKPIMRLVRPTRTEKEEAQRIPMDGQLSLEV